MLRSVTFGKRLFQKRLKLLVGFLNTDIAFLSSEEFSTFIQTFITVFYGEQAAVFEWDDTPLNRRSLKWLQDRTEKMLKELQKAGIQSLQCHKTIKYSVNIFSRIDILVNGNHVSIRPRVRLQPVCEQEDAIWEFPANVIDLERARQMQNGHHTKPANNKPSGRLTFSTCCDADVDTTILMCVASLLEKYSIDCIRTCPECLKYFSCTPRRRVNVCDRCHHKESTYQWRKKNRKVYNTYQRYLKKGIKKSTREIRKEIEP